MIDNTARWTLLPCDDAAVRALASELRIPAFVGRLLCGRGILTASDAGEFLRPQLRSLSDPTLLPQMASAANRLLAAVDSGERIVLYGDYDVDGVTSLAMLTRLLRRLGADPKCFLPDRIDEGYGLSADGLARCVAEHRPQLLVALDCGTGSVEEIASLRREGIDVLVFDHHEPAGSLPECTALVNPKLGDSFHYLCTGGIVFKLCHALLKARRSPDIDLKEYLDLAALATVADLVPLVGENRVLVAHGLRQMERTRWIGLRELQSVAGVSPPLRPTDIGFRLGPRLNAAGRLGTAQAALDLLLTDDAARARLLAADLDVQNRERQGVEKQTLAEAERQIAEWFEPARHAAIVAGGAGWHPGVVGIVASRIARQHYRPAIIVGFDDSGIGKGSGRSIAGLSLVESLGACGDLLEKFGGHEMAAGLTVREANFAKFKEAFLAGARRLLTDEQLIPRVELDCELALADLTFDTLDHHDILQPFGMGNREPLFMARAVSPAVPPTVLKEKHLRLKLQQNGTRFDAIFFNTLLDQLPRPPWDAAFRIERNDFRGNVSVQMQLLHVRSAE